MSLTFARIRCVQGRTMRRDPQPDDPNLETDIGQCEECDGDGCERAPAEFPSDRAPSCECHTGMNALLADYNTALTFNFFGGFRAIIDTYKIVSKIRKGPSPVVATYCPFCGVKYPEDRS
jgi:hypothetical protein